jgi:uncharacterized pyridoxal phosphate-dependent enzyme
MRAGAESFVDLPELQRKVGERIAQLTNNEACYVSSGAAAGVAIATAACMTRNNPDLVQKLPHLEEPRPEIIVHRNQRNGYDQAARQTGVRMVEIGDRSEGTTEADLEQAFSDRTVGVLYFAGAHFADGALPLEVVVAVARSHNTPVVVDAAAQIPPISNLWHFTRDLGADVAVFSGGKGLRGPQSSGVILGKKELIDACVPNGPPNHSVGRPMKVGKEELLGILAAIEWSLDRDEPSILVGYEATVQRWIAGLSGIQGVSIDRAYPSEAGQPHSRAILRLTPEAALTRNDLVAALWDGEPRIAVSEVGDDAIALNPQTLEPGEDQIVLDALRSVLTVAAR